MSAEGWEAGEGMSFVSALHSFAVQIGGYRTPVFIHPFIYLFTDS